MNNNSANNAARSAPKQPPSSYYRQRLASSIGNNASRAPPQSARAAIPNDTNAMKRPLENSYKPQPNRSSAPSNTLAPKDSFYKQAPTNNKPPAKPAPSKSNVRPNTYGAGAAQQNEPKRYHHPSYDYDLDVDMDDAYDEPTLVHQKSKRAQQQPYNINAAHLDDESVDVEMRDVAPIMLASQTTQPRRTQRPLHEFRLTPLNSKLLSDISYRGVHFYLRTVKEPINFVEIIARVQEVVKRPTATQAQWLLKINDDTSPQSLLLEYWDLNDIKANFELNVAYRFVGTLSPANSPTMTVKCFWFDAVRSVPMLKFNKLLTQIVHSTLTEP